ncbi:DUF3027 domain-containing protein [Microbacterium oxydans]|uniref:DUF3027 domain-containing protein n=1 Tax=Microbacterium TaxID=33882 RepID=UPI000DE21671|nr:MULTISPECIES: DUF3027 domain-containing protein [Microbacterium]KAB1893670.1 DUF3027 domain-containing protein [Microbacterium oxydans]NYF27411.1 hypothetical protein [Microbacterium sp. JAI119]RBO71432.1 DUF3027 domain-containing protein [Microbacterium sp. H6]GED38177.1 hypothetical protein MOX01_13190 [Microbacterium oxydans]
MTSKPDADARLLDAHDLALAALAEITPASTVGPAAGYLAEEDGSVSLRFENRLAGYPGWYWTVTVARVEDEEPTVLEVELLPGDGALLAPEWVPWAERLAEYRAHQVELAEAAAAAGDDVVTDDGGLEDDEDGGLDDDDLDDDDDDVEGDILHAGDVDGVDIDELDEGAVDDESVASEEDESEDDDADALDEDAGEVDEEE